MKNKDKNITELDMLLKQSFLELDFDKPENSEIMNTVISNVMNPPGFSGIFKSGSFGGKLLFYISFLTIGIVGFIALNSGLRKNEAEIKSNNITFSNPTLFDSRKSVVTREIKTENQKSIIKTPIQKIIPPQNKTDLTLLAGDSTITANIANNVRSLVLNKAEPDTGDYFPVLTEKEIRENNKRKKKMIEQLAKQSKNKYALIPMGSFVYKKDSFSVYSFYMQTTEVTNIEYRTFLIDLLIQNRKDDIKKASPRQRMWVERFNWSFNEPMKKMYFTHPAFDEYPVVNISREGAEMYCIWLTLETNKYLKEKGKGFINDLRLPVDIEWAYAAQGGNGTVKYANGTNDLRDSNGKYLQNYSCAKMDSSYIDPATKLRMFRNPKFEADGALHTAQVEGEIHTGKHGNIKKIYSPNNYGLFQMAGNVSEMVYLFEKDKKKYTLPGTKGGSWFSVDHFLEIDAEEEFPGETGPSPMIGFRPVMTAIKN